MHRQRCHPLISPRSKLSDFFHRAEGGNPTACPVINALDSDWGQELGPGGPDRFSRRGGTWLKKGHDPLRCPGAWLRPLAKGVAPKARSKASQLRGRLIRGGYCNCNHKPQSQPSLLVITPLHPSRHGNKLATAKCQTCWKKLQARN